MRVTVWGCRGSIASPGADTVRYGGNTSCLEVRLSDGSLIVLDAGTGARPLGLALEENPVERIDLLLTHLHLDHIEGLGAFEPIWDRKTELHIWGPSSPVASLRERIAMYFSPPLFPVYLPDVLARVEFHDAPEGDWVLGDARVTSHQIMHQGSTVGYRIEDSGRTLAYLTDHEPALGGDLAEMSDEWISGYEIARGADVLVHDCQYTPEEYAERVGFGHSSTEHVAMFARRTDVGRLILFHHDPMHTDDELDAMRERVIDHFGVDGKRVALAADGMSFEV
ncbi:MAG TPA: MBL fold metallo-hydrolase [Actinomycetota bacterium]|nr:MBL fold metallo-hydrolase [Actinomycetota bacterium]